MRISKQDKILIESLYKQYRDYYDGKEFLVNILRISHSLFYRHYKTTYVTFILFVLDNKLFGKPKSEIEVLIKLCDESTI